ncbi:MAG: fibronectin type III domain-containing protein, partial [Desulfococcaceae bacterium]|nr:fibronectin type III domain-containing protein [Desulfococcaceae bacterium]
MLNIKKILIYTVFLFFIFNTHSLFAAFINVTYPTAGANWKTTQTYNIQWNTISTKPTMEIYLDKNGSRKYTIVSGTPNDGQYEWTIPANTLINKNDEGNIYSISMCTDDGCGESPIFGLYFPPPPTPGGFSLSSVTSSSVSLVWGTSDGATGSEIYDCGTNSLVKNRYDGFYLGDTVSDLSPETTYHFKMRAVNTSGQSSFTSCIEATTPQAVSVPTVTTSSAGSITQTNAVSGGNVSSDGGATVIARGVCWSTSQNPTISNNKTSDGTGTGIFTSSISGLSLNTSYYVRSYATNSAGTAYGNQVSFTTLPSTDPSIVNFPNNVIINEDEQGIVAFSVRDGDTGYAGFTIRIYSDHPDMIPNVTIGTPVYLGTDGSNTYRYEIRFTPAANAFSGDEKDLAVIHIEVSDDHSTDKQTFSVRIIERNDQPLMSITSPLPVTGKENETQIVSLYVSDPDGGTLNLSALSDNSTLLQSSKLKFTLPGSTTRVTQITVDWSIPFFLELHITPETNQFGTANIQATVSDTSAAVNDRDTETFTCVIAEILTEVPNVETFSTSSITQTTASSGGNVTSDGGTSVTARGVCWSTSTNPTTANSKSSDGTGTGTFSSSITGLTANTTYYVRAYATNSA